MDPGGEGARVASVRSLISLSANLLIEYRAISRISQQVVLRRAKIALWKAKYIRRNEYEKAIRDWKAKYIR